MITSNEQIKRSEALKQGKKLTQVTQLVSSGGES